MNNLNIALGATFFLLLITTNLLSQTVKNSDRGGFLVLAGKNTTQLNSVLMAYNNYQKNKPISFLKKYPRRKNDSGSIIKFGKGLSIPKDLISYEWMALQTGNAYQNGNAVGVNKYGVAVGGIVSLSSDRNIKARKADPLKDKGVPPSICFVALQRAKTARQCIRLIGEFFNSYGISEAAGIAVADEEEIWYLETGGGSNWAAKKIPKNSCWIQGNSYQIGFIDPEESDVLASPNLISFSRKNDLWDPEQAFFNFSKAFGGRVNKMEHNNTELMKIWRAYNLLIPSKKISSNRKKVPNNFHPEEKITLDKLTSILSDEYRGTKFYPYAPDTTIHVDRKYQTDSTFRADTLFKIDSVCMRDTTYHVDSTKSEITPINNKSTTYSSIVEVRGGFRSEMKSVLWASPGNPLTTPFIPFYFGIHNIPGNYNYKFNKNETAPFYFRELSEIYYKQPNVYSNEFSSLYNDFQQRCFTEQNLIDRQVFRLFQSNADMAINFLTVTVDGYCTEAMEIAENKLEQLKHK